ncbi:enoyl-CoA hydratase/isomerase family protein [Modestobacter versicolor]|uniref:2-(1,2-epoxy-1,2-dihydrophenyl)acetyl-CoA isomerase n=1 Tax=Modestobacter versicolor TaxID=429133 RepID=A0A323VDL9_9ACTN|nr:enoyl-CoA hydratase-related protein [Modestobacter versicolor]MBB3676599.1 2-(1,2-epoxy-1,2-dihydrophenyl)acetyl-CoA isomerase [Modestobacter versicolor]PZA22300.1 enoyl-CoA hydratase [Modestobacter versicolor]
MTAPAARVTTALDGDVWRISLDAADTGNPVDRVMAGQLAEALDRRPAEARVVLLLSTGRDFCVGADLRGLAAGEDLPASVRALSAAWHQVVRSVLHCPVPVVAGVRGSVAGAGIGLLGACDLVVCGRSTKLHPAYGSLGLSPDGGTSWALTRALGAPRALELLLTDGVLHAADAHTFGLVARLVDDETLVEEVTALARSIAAGPVRAMVRTRGLVRRAAIRTLDEQLEDEERLLVESAADPEGREGVAAALAGRRPDFRGAR